MKTKKILAFLLATLLAAALITGCNNTDDNPNGGNDVSATPPVVTDGEEIGYEEGTSETDNIVLTSPADKVLLVVSFGTSFNRSRSLTIGGIETAFKDAFPDYQVRRAFTSQIIIDKLAQRDGLRIDNIEEALNRLVLDKVKEVVIQPTHVMSGLEYDDVIEAVMPFADKFESFKIGKPLLIDDIDYDEVAELIVQETTSYRADGTAVVFMGHGTEHPANATYQKLQDVLTEKGYNDYYIGTVEAEPTLDEIREKLEETGVTKVVLRPLMVVAGDHANNDMASDEEDSWKTILTGDGYEVVTVVEGLGQVKGIQDVYVRHVEEAIASADLSVEPVIAYTGVTGSNIADGVYTIEVDSDTSMFRIVDCQLTVSNGEMTAFMTLSAQGYGKIYMGTGEEALADTDNHADYVDNGERHAFTVPVAALDRGLDCAGFSINRELWYDHTVVFRSDSIPAEAFVTSEIDVTLTGGSGRATVDSPAKLSYAADKTFFAEIVWSSPNYTYMTIDGTQYLPVNTDGNSTFVIPVLIDVDMNVVACTVAMSEPREVEYVLRFDSASIS